ncbi:caspase family protein [Aerosakkonemataceae cyanobacterium BLCC-F50]|uniref:Caspase family protein n=1 Tax=Floridaenema flaviceps BLCC-F50 TaxID=3153642 RepID=A0ABV4Y0E2_9CYAN
MAKNIYALLVGIDNYHPVSVPSISSLKGCVNDIKAVEAYLRERIVKDSGWKLMEPINFPWILLNQDATRQAIINGFEQHLCNADSEDVVLFYYSGHGAQEKTPQEFWELEADRLNETLVCYDSRTEGGRDLADKELAYLISKVARNNPRVIIFLDCCHSGSGTRDLSPETLVRRSAVDSRERPLDSFIFANDRAALSELLTTTPNIEKKTTGLVLPKGKHVLFSACRDYELAKEYQAEDGEYRGAFSYFLLQTLERTNGNITYRDLARNINALVSGKVKDQSPQVEATDPEDLDKPFLGGAIKERPLYFTLTYSKNEQTWVIDGGNLHGIPKSSDGGDTLLAFFPMGSTTEQLHKLSQALGEVQVTQVLPHRSKVKVISGNENLSETQSYWAVVTSLPLPQLKIYIKGDRSEKKGINLVRQALLTAAPNKKPSLYVREVDEPQEANYYLLVSRGQYSIRQPDDNRLLVTPIPENSNSTNYTDEDAVKVICRLEHIARWNNILQLSTPATSRIKTDDVEMEIILLSGREETSPTDADGKISSSEMRVEYTYEDGKWRSPEIQIKLTNHSDKKLYCNVVNLSESFAVDVPFFEQTSSILLEPKGAGNASVIKSFEDLNFEIPNNLLAQGVSEYKEILKLIVCTTEFNASLLNQDGLTLHQPTRFGGEYRGTLNRLMNAVNTREAVRAKGKYDDWMTKEVTITIVRPQDAKEIKSDRNISLQNGVVEVLSHPSLKAKVNLTTVPQASRDLGNLILPPILRQQPRITQPFHFTNSRGTDPGLCALELSDVKDYKVVTSKQPLKLLVNTKLADNEHILPLAYDGEFFLPLGRGKRRKDGRTEIILERLPKPTASSRSLQGSIRIFFEKVASQNLGKPFEYPILAAVDFDENDKPIYEKDQEKVKARVAQAQRIILYTHGIIGDTESIVPSVRQATVEVNGKTQSIQELYDLVLTFDYENIQTTIEENARLLKQRLQAVGLSQNHEKQLHIVAHSMGGLVSRWFIEREGGNQIVQHLIMLGTPNAGSPWPVIQDWVFTTLAVGLNQLSSIIWPTKVLAQLLKFLEENDYSLDQMRPDSSFIKELAKSPDPHIPYTIIAGDRSIAAEALELQPNTQSTLLKRLMQKLFHQAVDKVVDWAFFSQPNDIAVTLDSIKKVSSKRSPQPIIMLPDTACDHLTYFTHPAGLNALAKALFPNSTSYGMKKLVAIATKKTPNKKEWLLIGLVTLLVTGIVHTFTVLKHESQKPVIDNNAGQTLPSDRDQI